jgi:hypothetical protein
MLTYDTTLQVVSWTAQQDLLLDDGLLGRHLFLLLAGVASAGEGRKIRGRNRGEEGQGLMETRGKSRTSCGSF